MAIKKKNTNTPEKEKKTRKKTTHKLIVSSFFKTITIDGKKEQVTKRIKRTLFFDNEETFPFTKIKAVEVAKDERDSLQNTYLRFLVLLHLTDGRRVLIDEVSEYSNRGGLKEMKNLGRKISMITGKELVLLTE